MKPAAFFSANALSLIAASAFAADLPSLKAPPVAPPSPQLWSGFYAGPNAGGVFQNDNAVNFTTSPSGTAPFFVNATPAVMAQRAPFWATQNGVISGAGSAGFIGGVQLGYNWRLDNLGGVVAGVEGDIQGLAAQRSNSGLTGGLYNSILASGDTLLNAAGGRPSSAQYLATLRGRLGYLVTPTLLAYATGGFAFGGVNFNATTSSLYTNAAGVQTQNAIGYTNFFNTQPGWAVGAGVEWMFMPHWSLKAEYLHFSLSGANIATSVSAYPIGTGGLPADWTITKFSSRVSGDIGRVGVNYHFYSDAPPTALAKASGADGKAGAGGKEDGKAKSRPRPGIPAGVYGALMNPVGEFRLVYHAAYTENLGNYVGSSTISPTAIVTTIPYFPLSIYDNRAPRFLRLVPVGSRIQMHAIRARYGVTDWLTVAATATLFDKNIDQTIFRGQSGAAPLSPYTIWTKGFGDSQLMALVRLYQDDIHHVHVNLGISLPTGSISGTSTNLSPSGAYQFNRRCCYGVQIGTGTYDALFGVTYTGKLDAWSWGFAYRGRVAMGLNSYGYLRGPMHEITGWGAYEIAKGLNLTARAAATVWDRVHGSDPMIFGPFQGTDPYYYGGERLLLLGGFEYLAKLPGLKPVRLAVEAGAPVYQRLNGPQLGESWELRTALAIGF